MSPQSTIAHYRIVSKLGEGGMGAVYRATDTKLNRDVAIKVIPEIFAADPDRLARFTREAQVLASLNHPNIAAIYGVEERALVLELVEGPTLAERIEQCPIPLEDALPIARQIAEALEYAHERGIVHRDLKPANLKVTPEGRVKVLDFGLAKALASEIAPSDAASSPTLTMRSTVIGMIMGTAAYMSPEQAKGKPVDRRADIWAFGVVLMEMLTGRTMHLGESVTETLASVIRDAPDFSRLPAGTPTSIRRLLKRCLDKDPQRRLRDIGEARVAIDDAGSEEAPAAAPVAAAAPVRRGLPVWAVAAPLTLAIAVLGGLLWRATRPVERPLLRFSADLGPDAVAGTRTTAAISRDGSRLAYPVRTADGTQMLATRLMDQSKPTILSGTENAQDPFFSPDGQWIGFFADGHLKKVSIQGGAPNTLCDVINLRGADWGEDGNILFGAAAYGLSRVSESGGAAPRSLSKPERGEISHRWPQILPGGEAILFTGHGAATGFDDASIEVLSLKTGQTRIVQRGGYFGRYLPSGHLVFIHQGTLFAVPFDLSRYETRGMPAPVLDDIAGNPSTGGGQLDFSRTGTLVYLSGKSSTDIGALFLLNAAGKKEPLLSGMNIRTPRFSPDGKRLAFTSGGDLAVYDLARGTTTRVAVSQGLPNVYPVWTPDGNHIAYAQSVAGIAWVRSDGSGQPQLIYATKTGSADPGSFTPDGRSLAFHQAGVDTNRDLWILPLDTTDPDHPKAGSPELFLATKGIDIDPAFSPDGRWLAYASNESGSFQIFVRPFPEGAKGGGQAQISTTPGRVPVWSRTAKEIFYVGTDGHIMVVPYTVNGRSFEPGKPRQWTESQILYPSLRYPTYDLVPDGKRFVVLPVAEGSQGGEKANLHMTFLLNFFDELKRKVPVGGK